MRPISAMIRGGEILHSKVASNIGASRSHQASSPLGCVNQE